MTNAKAALRIVGFSLLLISGGIVGGDVFRGEKSPWFWKQFPIEAARHGNAHALLEVAFYLAFYSLGFFLPYATLSVVLSVYLATLADKPGYESRTVDRASLQAGVILVSFGCMIGFVLMLKPVMAFFQYIPVDVWGGWLLILAGGASLFCVVAGAQAIRREVEKF